MAHTVFFPAGFKEELEKKSTIHIKKSQVSKNPPAIQAPISVKALADFTKHLQSSQRILALFGAGLSAPSGLATFRGSQDIFRGYDPPMLTTHRRFEDDPILSWWFYSSRRTESLAAKPNAAHYALAKLGDVKENFLAISQNIDGLSQRAGHEPKNLQPIHGGLFDLKCSDKSCDYVDRDNFRDPLVPALSVPAGNDIADENTLLPSIMIEDLPHCPKCNALLQPDVMWFGEDLREEHLDRIDHFIAGGKVDLMLVVGTCASVYPAASYIHRARKTGARIAYVDIALWNDDQAPLPENDWYFQGDAAIVVPRILESVL